MNKPEWGILSPGGVAFAFSSAMLLLYLLYVLVLISVPSLPLTIFQSLFFVSAVPLAGASGFSGLVIQGSILIFAATFGAGYFYATLYNLTVSDK